MNIISLIKWAVVAYLCVGYIRAIVLFCKLLRISEDIHISFKAALIMFVYVIIFWPFSFPFIVDFPDEDEKEVKEVEVQWRRAKAGTKLPEDCMIRYDNDPDIRLGRCMINDGWFLPTSEIEKYIK